MSTRYVFNDLKQMLRNTDTPAAQYQAQQTAERAYEMHLITYWQMQQLRKEYRHECMCVS